jgi:PRTRC genetic system protein A
MFRVFVNDGTQEMPDDDILYIVCKEGIYLKKKLGIMESITPVKGISVLESVAMTAQMNIKPVPGILFAQVMSFFREVYDKFYGEAIVLLFYNEEKRVYKVVPPAQKVSGGGIDYNRAMQIDGYTMIGDIHSHANMSAFHSGIDDADETSFDGLHITIGNNKDPEVSISTSIVSNGQRFIVNTEDYVKGIRCTVDIDEVVEKPMTQYYVWNSEQKKLVPQQSKGTYKVKKYDKRYVSSVSAKYQKHPAEWMSVVEKKVWTGWQGNNWWNNTGRWWKNWNTDKFDPMIWNQQRSPLANSPLIPSTTNPITFPPHNQNNLPVITTPVETKIPDGINPCEKCPFLESKLDWALEKLKELGGLVDDDAPAVTIDNDGNEIEWYQCMQCDSIVPAPDGLAECPICKTDMHLVLMDQEDFESSVVTHVSDLDWYRCIKCTSIFETADTNAICPICKTNSGLVKLRDSNEIPKRQESEYLFKCLECGTESSILNNGDCAFCGGKVVDRIDQDALRAAQIEDEIIPLQVPNEEKIPLAKQNSKRGVFARIFKKDK